MRCPCVALAIKPSANEMNIGPITQIILPILQFVFESEWVFWGSYPNVMHFFPKTCYRLVGIKSLLRVPDTDCFAFSDPTLKTHSVGFCHIQ